MTRRIAPLLLLAMLAGCAGARAPGPAPAPTGADRLPIQGEADGLRVTLAQVRATGADPAADFGWLEFVVEIENRGATPLRVTGVRLLNGSGRYFPPATTWAETQSSPAPAYATREELAARAAGQLLPFGGLVVQAITGINEARTAKERARAEHQFRLRQLADVELAPGGRMEGSAYFPRIPDPRALVVTYSRGGPGPGAAVSFPLPQPGEP